MTHCDWHPRSLSRFCSALPLPPRLARSPTKPDPGKTEMAQASGSPLFLSGNGEQRTEYGVRTETGNKPFLGLNSRLFNRVVGC